MAAVPIFAQGTDQNYVDSVTQQLSQIGAGGTGNGLSPINLAGSRWTNPTGGPSPNMGDPATISWSIVPDGTQVSTLNGGLAASNLIARMDQIYGGGTGPVANRPWFNIIQRAYDTWAAESGLTFIYEPNDDGADYSAAARGVRNVRGDVRIGGNNVDGDFGVLAFNYYPNGSGNTGFDGDMVIDTNDRFFADNANGPSGENRGLFNVLMHEAGHGIGLGHVIPTDETKLMEPFVSFQYLGAQYDDILAAQTLYGDNDETNDTIAAATNLGNLGNGVTTLNRRSIDRNADVDLYRFTIDSAGIVSLTVTPDGRQYDVGPQGGNAAPVNTFLNKDLSFQIEQPNGTILTTVSGAANGQPEVLTNFALPAGGTYIIRILGAGSETQPYIARMTLSGITTGTGGNVTRAPRLLSIAPNSGEIFSTTSPNNLIESPRELVFRFDAGLDPKTLAQGIKILRSGGDGVFGAGSALADAVITPAFLNFGETERIVIARFAEPLPDDLYRIQVFGADLPSESAVAIRNLNGDKLTPRKAGTDRDTYDFNLELGTKIVAIVPQPVDRNSSGVISQRRSDIDVYFNDAELYNQVITTGNASPNPTVVDPQFYNLILTKDTVSPNDDIVFHPNSITYDPAQKKATLTFATAIDQLTNVNGSGTFRLRIGSNEPVASALNNSVVNTISPADPGGVLSTAADLGTVSGSFSTIINQQVLTESNPLQADYPGSDFEPGHRDIQDESHRGVGPDAVDGTTTIFYSFMDNQSYGVDVAGRPLFTSITDDQRARVREIFEFYSAQLGIDVVEHSGATATGDGVKKIVVGDMAPNGAVSGPLDVLGVAQVGGELAIMDGSETWDNGFGFGSNIPNSQSFFYTALHEIGHLLGLGHTYDLPPGTVQGAEPSLGRAANPLEQIFPGDADVIHGQHLFRPDNRDVDLYKFVVQPGARGELRAETIAERLNNSSTVDTYLTLLQRQPDGTLTIVAANNNYFSDDSLIRTDLGPGEYYLSVTGKGNEDNNPLTDNSGSGAVSQGQYQLRIDFKSKVANQISEQVSGSTAIGTALDGDGDGLAGGNFDFWFRAAAPIGVAAPSAPRTIFVDKAFTGVTRDGSLTRPFNRILEATAVARPEDIIRLVGDTRTASLTDERAFEIGNGGTAIGTLNDGSALDVPRGVTLMIDAGAILKFGGSKILIGSSDSTSNRSNAAIQVLGTPSSPVYFTSYFDESLGKDTNSLTTSPGAGQWGGIEIRNDFDRSQGRNDREREGIFLNTISNADIRFGGGQVGVGASARVVSPISLTEARPLILSNKISNSADSAMSADPNSFEETLFTESRYQNAGAFAADYSRVGPVIRGNLLVSNSVNGLFMRIDTLPAQTLKPLSVPARIDDSEITIVLGENLVVEGTPGGPIHETVGPDTSLMTLTAVTPTSGTGFAVNTAVNYLLTYMDKFGQESLPSGISTLLVPAGQSVRLSGLPTATLDYISRKIWRQDNNTGAFKLVAVLNRDDVTFVDNAVTLTGQLQTTGLVEIQRARRDASLVIDPGVVLKSAGGRIEVGISATMLAEGSQSKPIIFTSRRDDRYGAAGNFDTNNDKSGSAPGPGDWAGIISRHLGELSIDNALITFGGGTSRVPGGFASFNAIEIDQSTARIANSIIENNAAGTASPGTTNRDARGINDAAAIFVLGSQPVIINNVIRNNFVTDTAAISVDANSMNTKGVRDYGRSTGLNNRFNVGLGNFGPLVNNNQLGGNGANGMRVRGATLTTESVWDDTDIVHILQSEIVVPDFHTYGGLRLTSKSDESLVVKLSNGGGFTATGRPLDIKDRIGGSLQIIGTQGFPVVLTSLSDDTIGAGFDFSGKSLSDTNGDGPSVGTVGGWRSLQFDPFSNDRNVDFTYERESDQIASRGFNDFPDDAEVIGSIASNLSEGDENLRLGVTVTGTIASPSDVDVYRFVGTAGTMVWFDLDQTAGSLDSVLELVDANGQIITLSDNSIDESANGSVFADNVLIPEIRAFPMDQRSTAKTNVANGTPIDFLGVNPLDAGFRAVLPGVAGSTNNYYIRVRSSNITPELRALGQAAVDAKLRDPGSVNQGVTTGSYKLQVRLQQTDEVAGSTVRFADIRFAAVGIDAKGQPLHSQLVGEVGEPNPNERDSSFNNIIGLGNIFSNDRAGVSIGGNFAPGTGSIASGDNVDWYSFQIARDSTQQVSSSIAAHQSVVFDVDYADGFGRANTQLWIYVKDPTQPLWTLVATADDSNIQDDQPTPGRGSDLSDLTRGSTGHRDSYLGPFELPPGQYIVAISNKAVSSDSLRVFTEATVSANVPSSIKYEPIESVQRISEDRFDVSAPARPTTSAAPVQVAFGRPQDAGLMSTAVPNAGNAGLPNAVPFNLSDVTLFAAFNGGNQSEMTFANALTGALEARMSLDGNNPIFLNNNGRNIADIAVSPAGAAIGVRAPDAAQINDANSSFFFGIDIGDSGAAIPTGGAVGLTTYSAFLVPGTPPTIEIRQSNSNGNAVGDGFVFNALAFTNIDIDTGNNPPSALLYGVGNRGAFNETPTGGIPTINRNIIYKLNPTTGAVIDATTQLIAKTTNDGTRISGAGGNLWEYGYFSAAVGNVTGMTSLNNVFFGVTDQGELVTARQRTQAVGASTRTTIKDLDGTVLTPVFTGLTTGPRNVENGRYANTLFGITATGQIFAFDTNGNLQPIFRDGAGTITNASLAGVAGIDFSSLDVNLWQWSDREATLTGHGRPADFSNSRSQTGGDRSLKFGFSDPNAALTQIGNWQGIYNVANFVDNFAMPGGSMGALESDLLDLRSYSADDQPMLYFNYSMLTQNNALNTDGSAIGDNRAALDSFRVYGAGADGNWVLLGTNNSIDNRLYDGRGPLDEFDVPVNGNVDIFGRSRISSELFDGQGWRQARINLASLAGKQDVRIRFEFNTSGDFRTGDPLRGGNELVAIPGERLRDGDTFTVRGTQFEFDMGLVLELPSGASIADGDRLIVDGKTFTFKLTNTPAALQIGFATNFTPAQVAAAVQSALQLDGKTVVVSTASPNILNVLNLNTAGTYSTIGLDPGVIIGRPGVAAGNTSVSVTNAMTATQVRDAIRTSFATQFNVATQKNNIDIYRVRGNVILLQGVGMTIDDQGPLGATTVRNGDFFGPRDGAAAVSGGSLLRAGLRTQSNKFGNISVVQIDDIVIGFAERGEKITGSPAQNQPSFSPTPGYELTGAGGLLLGGPIDEIERGTYQLEIRAAADYGTTDETGALRLESFPPVGRSYDTNDRLTKSTRLTFTSPGTIADGAFFTLSDGLKTATFEFDVTTSNADKARGVSQGRIPIAIRPGATQETVARAIRDAINSTAAQAIMSIAAANNGDMRVGTTDINGGPQSVVIDLYGPAASDDLGNMNFSAGGVAITVQTFGDDTGFGEDLGDGNINRDQGQLIISSSTISDSAGFGLNIDAAAQAQGQASTLAGPRPYPGAVRNLNTLNAAAVAPGVVVMNNVLARNAQGGINVSGDTVNGNGNPPNSIARIINNTLYGNKASDVGINVSEGASPTILNNIVANFGTGISVAGATSVSGTVLGGNIYQTNTANVNPFSLGNQESNAIYLTATEPLFIDGPNGYYYLAALSQAIDSSIASLENRANIEEVKKGVGLPKSPLLAPGFDVNGLRRGDDPDVNTPIGVGQNVFIDRGAIDRVDSEGPIAVLQRPLDNDSAGLDSDPWQTYVRLTAGNYDFFEVLLDERTGTGTDARTITADSLVLTENGRPLTQGVDYVFGFSANSRTIRLTPLAGFWRRDSVYEMTLINKASFRIDALDGSNISDGKQINLVTTSGNVATLEYDSGYSISVPETLTLTVPASGSAAAGITDGQTFTITNGTTVAIFEFDTNNATTANHRRIPIVADQTAQQVRDSIIAALSSPTNADLNLGVKAVGTASIHLGSVAGHAVDIGTSRLTLTGVADGVADGQKFVFDPVSGPAVTFEFNLAGDATFGSGNQIITFQRTDTYLDLAAIIANAVKPFVQGGFAPVQDVGSGVVNIGGKVGDTLDVSTSTLTATGAPGVTGSYTLTVPALGGSTIADATTFSIKNVAGQTIVFEFNKDATVNPNNRGISIRDTDSAIQVAQAIANSIASSTLGFTPTSSGAVVTLNEPRGTAVNVQTSPLTLAGASGGAIAIPFVPSASFKGAIVGAELVKAFSSIGLGVNAYALGEGTVLVEGLTSINGVLASSIPAISDLAANWLRANRANSLTQFTILMPEVKVDYGDAIERSGTGSTSSTLLADNGVRHALYPEDMPILALGQFADGDADGVISKAADADDFGSSLTFSGGIPLSLATNGPAQLTVSAPTPAMVGKSIKISDTVNKTVTFEFANGSAALPNGNIPVDLTGAVTALDVLSRLQAAVLQSILDGSITGIISILEGNVLSVGGSSAHVFDLSASGGFVQRVAKGALGIVVPANVAALAQGQTIQIQDGSGNTVVFQIIGTVNPIPLISGNTPLVLNLATTTQSSFALALQNAINAAIAANKLRLPPATIVGNTVNVSADDEDGVQFNGLFNPKTPPVQAVITSTDTGFLDAWIDWNQDNDFDDAGEQILRSEPVKAGQSTFSIITPAGTPAGYTTARFRLSATGGLFTYGLAVGGEVEDHVIEILPGEPPVAVDDPAISKADKYRVDEDNVLNVTAADGVLFNDSDVDSATFSVYDTNPNLPGLQPLVNTQNGQLVLNADGSFTYTPNPNFFGQDTFVYQVTDPRMVGNQPATVTITVNPINDVPFATTDTVTIDEDTPQTWAGSLFTANDVTGITLPLPGTPISNESGQSLRIKSVQLINAAGQPVAPITAESLVLSNNVITYRPGSNYNNLINGPVRILLEVEDDGVSGFPAAPDPKSAFSTLTVNVTPVNDRPLFAIPNNTIALSEDPTPANQVRTNFLTNIFAGPVADLSNNIGPASDELGNVIGLPGQVVSFNVRALDPTRFAVQPAVTVSGTNGNFTFTLAPDVNLTNSGPILVEVIAVDDGNGTNQSLPQTITINVTPVNDPPIFTIASTNFNTTEDAPRTIIPNFLTNIGPGPATAVDEANQTTTVSIVAATPAYYSVQPRLTGTGDLEFQLAPNVNSLFSGSLNILITVTDDGSPNASTTKTLTVTAADINDQPTFALNKSLIVVQEDNEQLNGIAVTTELGLAKNLIPGPAGQPGVGAADEFGLFPNTPAQALTFTNVSISNPTLFSQLPVIDGNGNLTFHTAPNRSGTATVVVRLTDNGRAGPPPNNNLGPTATFTITITPVNDAPEFSIPASTTVNEDQGVVSLPGFATGIRPGPGSALDESTQELTFLVRAEDPNLFSVQPSLQADGTLVFQTAKDVNNNTANIRRRVFVSLRDNGASAPPPNTNLSAEQTFTLNVTPVNDPPLPDSQTMQGTEDQSMTIDATDVTAGDAPGPLDEVVEGQLVRMTQIERNSINGGSVEPVFSGGRITTFKYTPPQNFVGADFIRYVVTDDGTPEQSATGTLTIQLAPVNDPPQFVPGADVTVQEDAAPYSANWATDILAGPPTALDEISGLNAQSVSFEIVTDNDALFIDRPAISSTGVLTFTLAKDANGRAIVDVVAVDNGSSTAPNVNRSSVSKLTIVANPVNDAPGFNVIGNISVDEDSGRFSGPAIRDIVPAQGMNDVPSTGGDESGQSVTLVTTNNNTKLFSTQPTINASGVLEFVPAQDAFGTAIVSVIARDGGPNTPPNVNESQPKTFTIVIRPINDAPVAVNDRYSTGEDDVLTVALPGVISNDRDVDLPDDAISIKTFQATSTLGARVDVASDGSFTYDSRNSAQLQGLVEGQTRTDTFTYTLRDRENQESNLATVTITVSGSNDNPVAVNDNFSVPFGVSELLNVLANDKDVDTPIDPRTVEIGQLAAHGTATALSTGRIQYVPAPGYRGPDSFTYKVRDSLGAISNEALVTIVVNTAPVAQPDTGLTTINKPVVISVLRNDNDPDGSLNVTSLSIANGPDTGTATVQSDGTIRYVPAKDFTGTATLQYAVEDNEGLSSNLATVTIQVVKSLHQNPVNNLDVDADTFVSPIDVLLIVNDLNFNGVGGVHVLPENGPRPPYLDVDGDGVAGPLDVLTVVNFINQRGNGGIGGEGEGSMATLGYSQQNVLMVPEEEVIRATEEVRQISQLQRQVDLAVASVAKDSVLYGPVLPEDAVTIDEETLAGYVAGLVTKKSQRSTSALDVCFADEDWL